MTVIFSVDTLYDPINFPAIALILFVLAAVVNTGKQATLLVQFMQCVLNRNM